MEALSHPTSRAIPEDARDTLLAALHSAIVEALGQDAEALTIERAVLGIFFTGVKLSNGTGGLCATPIKSVPMAVCCPSSANAMPIPGKIAGRPALQVLGDLYRPQDLRRTLAIATLNALAETLWLRDGPPAGVEVLGADAFNALTLTPEHYVALVGAFPPYLKELRRRKQPFNILELDPETLKPDEMPFFIPASQAAEVVPKADALITTGTTLINGSLDGLLAMLPPHAQAAVIGPTATLFMPPYAERGVTVVGGTRVHEPDELLTLLAEGGSGYHFFEKTVERVTLRVSKPA